MSEVAANERELRRKGGSIPVWSDRITASRRVRVLLALATVALAAGCAPSVERIIRVHDLGKSIRTGSDYRHLVVFGRAERAGGARLHVYIEGDGRPFVNGRRPSGDPTPRRPLALEMMLADASPAVYVGRPCYFGVDTDGRCTSDDWTFGRYGPDIIRSMAAVIADIRSEGHYDELLLIGYSGGGAIARLVAASTPGVVGVVTVAANLDTRAWTEARGFLPLSLSLNPAEAKPLPAGVPHVQIVGASDRVVPPAVTSSYRATGQAVDVWEYADFDHACCWVDAWPSILERVDLRLRPVPRRTIDAGR